MLGRIPSCPGPRVACGPRMGHPWSAAAFPCLSALIRRQKHHQAPGWERVRDDGTQVQNKTRCPVLTGGTGPVFGSTTERLKERKRGKKPSVSVYHTVIGRTEAEHWHLAWEVIIFLSQEHKGTIVWLGSAVGELWKGRRGVAFEVLPGWAGDLGCEKGACQRSLSSHL